MSTPEGSGDEAVPVLACLAAAPLTCWHHVLEVDALAALQAAELLDRRLPDPPRHSLSLDGFSLAGVKVHANNWQSPGLSARIGSPLARGRPPRLLDDTSARRLALAEIILAEGASCTGHEPCLNRSLPRTGWPHFRMR